MKTKMRLDKMLGNLGYGTRSSLKALIRQGAVTVNGVRVKDHGMQIDPHTDEVVLEGQRIEYRDTVYLMLNKPAGFVSATEDKRDRTVLDLLPDELAVFAPFPVGRLDKDTEGLLLLTNDGKLSHDLLSPRKHVPKTYRALVAGHVDSEDIATFATGVTLDDGYVTLPAELRVLSAPVTYRIPDADRTATEVAGAAAVKANADQASTGETSTVESPTVVTSTEEASTNEASAGQASSEKAAARGFTAADALERLAAEPALKANYARLKEASEANETLSWIELTIDEGKYHQVKRMFESVGKSVLYLRRTQMGPLPLDGTLTSGEWRELTEEEIASLRADKKTGESST